MKAKPFIAVNIVPTGIAADIGGYAGDAGPANKLLASCCDYIIANPNVVNAATMYNIPENLIYAEGSSIDRFFKEEIAFRKVKNNKIGIVFDRGIPENTLNINFNALSAARTVYGLDITGHTITNSEVGIEFNITEDGFSSGTIKNTETLLTACKKMIDAGAEALAVVCYFPDTPDDDQYAKGNSADPVGGIEAIISHLVSKEFNVPCAHAPAFSYEESLPSTNIVDPRTASEYFSPTFLPCILYGLNKAPKLVNIKEVKPYDITIGMIDALVYPHNCLGAIPVLSAVEKKLPVFAIKNNSTILNVDSKKLGIENQTTLCENYLEACGHIVALRQGICPSTIIRPIQETFRL